MLFIAPENLKMATRVFAVFCGLLMVVAASEDGSSAIVTITDQSPLEASVGSSLVLHCKVRKCLSYMLENLVTWRHVPPDGRETELTRNGEVTQPGDNMYAVDIDVIRGKADSEFEVELAIINVQPESAGRYICRASKMNQTEGEDFVMLTVTE